ncbi:unnamed protein product [Linum tenue]|uniref:Uncharacterized protein n=1 Tax=Linum tenue TaxID=586396 RepID=A0AAV0JAI4_9ROSI|nr:unnamed protein product [Linum tenue]
MKKKKPSSAEEVAAVDEDARRRHHEQEILKAAAQAWYSHSGIKYSNPTTSEHDAHRRSFHGHRPSRFRTEALIGGRKSIAAAGGGGWDFRQSLLDSHEIVAVSRKLESRGIVALDGGGRNRRKVERESRSSLRNLLHRIFL